MSLPNKLSLFVSCAGGVEPLLEEELKRFLPPGVRSKVEPLRGGCGVVGSLEDAMRINLESRLAQRVLIELIEGRGARADFHDPHIGALPPTRRPA